LAYTFLNFCVGVRQQGFWIKGVKCSERNPFLAVVYQIAGIPVNQSSDNRVLTVIVKSVC